MPQRFNSAVALTRKEWDKVCMSGLIFVYIKQRGSAWQLSWVKFLYLPEVLQSSNGEIQYVH